VILMSLIPILVVDLFKLFKINGTRDGDGKDPDGLDE